MQMQVSEEKPSSNLIIKMPPIQYSPFIETSQQLSFPDQFNQVEMAYGDRDRFTDQLNGVPDNKDFKLNNNKSLPTQNQESSCPPQSFNMEGSLFFRLKHPSLQNHSLITGPALNDNLKRTLTSLITQQRIPTIQEWFSFLSPEDKHLSLSLVNQRIVDHLIKMILKIRNKGQGLFKLEQIKRIPRFRKIYLEYSIAGVEQILQFHPGQYSNYQTFNILRQIGYFEQDKSQKLVTLLLKENQLIDQSNKLYEIIFQLKANYYQDPNMSREQIFLVLKSSHCLSATILLALFENQDASYFTSELCLTSINKVDSDLFDVERDFINLVVEQFKGSLILNQRTLKNQKKKNKRKQKKLDAKNQQQQQKQQQDGQQASCIRKQSQSHIPVTERIKKAQINELNKDEINNLLEDIINEIEENKDETKLKDNKEDKDHSQCYDVFSEDNFNLFQLLEMNTDLHEVEQTQGRERIDRLEKISAFSDSTEDILGNFSSETFKNQLKSPQASTNTEIELTMRKNLFSSDAGDSSIQLQKQFSDFYMKDSSHQNIDNINQTKTKESLDNIAIDVSISNENITKQDESMRNPSSKRIQLQLPASPSRQDVLQEEKTFQIIRSSQNFQQEQQTIRQNQRNKKKKKRKAQGAGSQNYNLSQQQKQMNSFIRGIHNHYEQDDYDDYGQEEADYQDQFSLQKGQLEEQKQRPIYVKKGNNGNQGSPTDETIELTKSQSTSLKYQELINQQNFFTPIDNQKKKKSFTKAKKTTNSGWEKNNKKKSGKSKNTSQQQNHQHSKQSSYDQQAYNQNMGQLQSRSLSMYDSPYHPIDPIGFINGQIDIDDIKQLLQKNIIQDIIAQQQQQNQLSMQRAYSEQYVYNQRQDQNEADDEYDEEDKEQRTIEQFFDMLESQMIMFQKSVEKKLESVRKEREEAIKIIRRIVEGLYQQERNSVTIKQYGSMASNLAIDSSDVDLAVVGLEFCGNKDTQIYHMRRLIEQIQLHMKKYTKIQFIDQATVPVIKLEIDLAYIAKNLERNQKNDFAVGGAQRNIIDESMRKLGVDITFDDTKPKQHFYGQFVENNSRINLGVRCINFIKESCKNQSGLQTIVLVLKKLLQINNLNQTFTGGLNSYSIVLMTSAYLQQFEGVSQMSMNLMEFFNFYGSFYDPKNTIISSHVAPHFIKSQHILNEHMIIIDPLDSGNNPSKGAYQISKIQEIFKVAHSILSECLNLFKHDQREIDIMQLLMRRTESLNTFGII
ncbi:UNKNOWN [Stylonychia lemnae]|uniref:Poly(A) RNA polymerase mitochondrial-like central palm domain-containing protein n=1 Tax=Stylonychia lemnae TaxID=5949 RepID=A0A078AWH4_STYLE|nr:UNKNOWN [Stylonychia lemnae]|eukprot:CDW85158.1 UNKNOWN [Stylonychia lemnae]